MNALVPSLSHVCFVSIKTAPMAVMVVGFNIGSLFEPALDRSDAETYSFGDLFDFGSLLSQRYHLLIAIIPLGLMSRVGLAISSQQGWRGLHGLGVFGCFFLGLLAFSYLCPTPRQRLFDRFGQIFAEMETIGCLNRLGSALAGSSGVIATTITADQFNFCVRLHPDFGRVRLAVRKEINNSVAS